jgi:hypothetical protein
MPSEQQRRRTSSSANRSSGRALRCISVYELPDYMAKGLRVDYWGLRETEEDPCRPVCKGRIEGLSFMNYRDRNNIYVRGPAMSEMIEDGFLFFKVPNMPRYVPITEVRIRRDDGQLDVFEPQFLEIVKVQRRCIRPAAI